MISGAECLILKQRVVDSTSEQSYSGLDALLSGDRNRFQSVTHTERSFVPPDFGAERPKTGRPSQKPGPKP